MRTLYVSDLDGTLLRSDETISEESAKIINQFVSKGGLFSFATARSLGTSKKVTKGLDARIPVIVYNGVFVMDYKTNEVLIANYFGKEIKSVLNDIVDNEVYPIVYSYIDGKERLSLLNNHMNDGILKYLNSRKGDQRIRFVDTFEELLSGDIFYINMIDEKERLDVIFNKYKNEYHCIYGKDIYFNDYWLEIMPKKASKANALKQLKEYLNCDYVISFGDGINDIDMFEAANESYAMGNACDELKKKANGILQSNDNDSVALFIKEKEKLYRI